MEAIAAGYTRDQEIITRARKTGNWQGVDPKLIREEAAKTIITTTDFIPGYSIDEIVGVASSDYAYAFGAIFESIAGLARNIAGSGKSGQTANFLREGRAEVLQALKFHALDLNAHAIIGAKIDYEEFSGSNNHGVLVVTATGTAVRISPKHIS